MDGCQPQRCRCRHVLILLRDLIPFRRCVFGKALPVAREGSHQLPVAYGGTRRSGQDHEVKGWASPPEMLSKAFPDYALQPVTPRGFPVHLPRYRHAQTRPPATVRPRQNSEKAIGGDVGFFKNPLKINGFCNSCLAGECCAGWRFLVRCARRDFSHRAAQLNTSGVRTSGGEALSAFGATCPDDGAPGPCGHPRAKPVPAGTFQAAWLECTLHNCCSLKFPVWPGAVSSATP